MTLREVISIKAKDIQYAGHCDCGEKKYDLITEDNLAYPPVHESTI